MLLDAHRLQAIATEFYGGRIGRNAAREQVIDVVLDRIDTARVSLWKFEGREPDLLLLGFAAKARGGTLELDEHRLHMAEYREYFNHLIVRGTFVSDDAENDPALAAMRDGYVERFGVSAILDAAFLLNGRAWGMVCCEQLGLPRRWKPGEVHALRAIVTRIAMLMASYDDPALWDAPSLALKDLEPPRVA